MIIFSGWNESVSDNPPLAKTKGMITQHQPMLG